MGLAQETHFVEIIFHTKKLEKMGDIYKQSFYTIKDDCVVDTFLVTNEIFSFEYTNKTGAWVKEMIKDIESF